MRPCDVRHDDPLPLARAAALASGREQDPRTRERARAMSMAERMRAGFELSRFAWRVRGARR